MTTGRCFVCARPGCEELTSTPKDCPHYIFLCNRHKCELDKLGWSLMCEKYDFLDRQLFSLGLCSFGDRIIYKDFRDWKTGL